LVAWRRADLLASGADAVVERLLEIRMVRGDARPDILSITIV
jgi:hypothetical protein